MPSGYKLPNLDEDGQMPGEAFRLPDSLAADAAFTHREISFSCWPATEPSIASKSLQARKPAYSKSGAPTVSASSVAMSPTGTHIATLSSQGGGPRLICFDLASGKAVFDTLVPGPLRPGRVLAGWSNGRPAAGDKVGSWLKWPPVESAWSSRPRRGVWPSHRTAASSSRRWRILRRWSGTWRCWRADPNSHEGICQP